MVELGYADEPSYEMGRRTLKKRALASPQTSVGDPPRKSAALVWRMEEILESVEAASWRGGV
jgi:hypothetical protein